MLVRALRLTFLVVLLGAGIAYAVVHLDRRAGVVELRVVPDEGREEIPLREREVEADVIRRHVDFVPEGGPGCGLGGEGPAIDTQSSEVAVGHWADFCFVGFGAGPVRAELRHGDRVVVHRSVSEGAVWRWTPLPGDIPPGSYELVARRGKAVARRRIRVVTSIQPFVATHDPSPGRSDVYVVVGGVAPSSVVPVHLYRLWHSERMRYPYFSTIRVRADANGNGKVRLRPDDGDTLTCYVVEPGFRGEKFDPQMCFGGPYD